MEGRKNLPGQGSSEQGEQKVEAAAMEHEDADFFVVVTGRPVFRDNENSVPGKNQV